MKGKLEIFNSFEELENSYKESKPTSESNLKHKKFNWILTNGVWVKRINQKNLKK